MNRWLWASTAAVALALSPMLTSSAANTVGGPVPANLYPARAHTTYSPDLSNDQVDCEWGFVCPGGDMVPTDPLFHSLTQDELHRTGGWGENGIVNRRNRLMLFFLFASRYDSAVIGGGPPWVVAAFKDLIVAARAYGYVNLVAAPSLLRAAQKGAVLDMTLRGKPFDHILLASWVGSRDVEALAVYKHGSVSERRLALRDLTAQVLAALG